MSKNIGTKVEDEILNRDLILKFKFITLISYGIVRVSEHF